MSLTVDPPGGGVRSQLIAAMETLADRQGTPTYFTPSELIQRTGLEASALVVSKELKRGTAPEGMVVKPWSAHANKSTTWMLAEEDESDA